MALPSQLSYCKITGRFLTATADGPDPDQLPDGIGLERARITFTAAVDRIRVADVPVTAFLQKVTVLTDKDGYLYNPSAALTDGYAAEADRCVYLVAGDDPDMDPHGWTYNYEITDANFTSLAKGTINATSGGVIDLGSVVEVPPSPGTSVLEWQAAVTDAQAAQAGAETARDQAASSATGAETAWGAAAAARDQIVALRAKDPILAALGRDLAAGRSTGIHFTGDSTGASDGTVSGDQRICERLARTIAANAPDHVVLMKTWNASTGLYGPWVILQDQTAGRRRLVVSQRSLKYSTATPFASGQMDLRVLVSMPSWPASEVSLLSRQKRLGGTNDLQFEFLMESGGYLRLRWSTSGSGWNVGNIDSSTAITPSAGVPIWLRVTADLSSGTSATTAFYTSLDGVEWTQVGTDTRSISAALFTSSSDAYISVGAGGWQPTFQPFTGGSIYEVQVRDGINGGLIAPASPERWDWYADGGSWQSDWAGAPVVYVTNASISGSSIATHSPLIAKETQDYGQVAAIFNDSHNEAALVGEAWISAYKAWVAAASSRIPTASVVVILQNPRTSAWANYYAQDPPHRIRLAQLSAIAPTQRWAVIDVWQAFQDAGLSTLVSADGLHPTQAGYALAGRVLAEACGLTT